MPNLLDTIGGTGPFGLNARLMIPLIYSAVILFIGPAFLSIIWSEWLMDRFGRETRWREPGAPEGRVSVLRPGEGRIEEGRPEERKPAAPEKKRAA